jgi:hypothetical protein
MRRRRLALSVGASAAVAALAAAAALVLSSGPTAHHPPTPPAPPSRFSTTAVSPGPGPTPRPPPGGEVFGANVNLVFNDAAYSQPQIDAQLRALRATGVTVARSDAFWESAEPTAPIGGVHHYRWQFDDRIAASLAAAGLRWMPILDYSAPWAQSVAGQDHSPPSQPGDYAAYAAAFAARYRPGGSFWTAHPALTPEPVQTYEIWNEPDNREFWVPSPNPGQYAALYEQAREAILAVDPSARVIVGGLTSPTTFLPAMLTASPDPRVHIDGVAIHPYGKPFVMLAKIRADRAMLTALGLPTVPLYVTEFGWTTRPAGALDFAPESARPGYLTATVAAIGHLNCGVVGALLYTWVSPQRDPTDPQDWYGINDPNGGSTPDVAAFAAGLRAAARSEAPIRLCGGG